MGTLDDAARSVRRALEAREPLRERLPGLLGNGSGLVTGSRPNTSLVRVGTRPAQEIWNMSLPNIENLPVWVGYSPVDNKRMEVLGLDVSRFVTWQTEGGGGSSAPYVAMHGATHSHDPSAPYSDPVWTQKRAIIPLLCRPTSPPSMSVRVFDDYYPYGASWKRYAGETTASLAGYIPASGLGRFITLYIDGATNTLQMLAGDTFSSPPSPIYDAIPTPPNGSVPVCAIAVHWATTEILEEHLYDIRLIFNAVGGTVTPLYNDAEGDPVLLEPDLAALDGTSLYPSRRDHRHNLKIFNSGMPSGVQAYALRGVSRWAAREDHIHSVGSGVVEHYMLSTAVQNAIAIGITDDPAWAAKGDLIVGTADDTAAILSADTDGMVLTLDAAEPTGMKWATPSGGPGGADMDEVVMRIWFGG